ncbi:PREDICTED: uncharacterized protein LOC109585374 [Amphimedon queenslandica]|uniref:Death domain-containing protein n=1 Tax=Amphimedon queenslandica TaxID=400682 RepID=A0A1X7TZ24_AMPQE|nr:PREDICTED: uncharacterized protein LOC109585374 [Amphimedon queenslandica]|eukprot:XP_019856987.1 PREDICTED: uncharacterized protein LOC109585374 [Amphimedon queenslandica]
MGNSHSSQEDDLKTKYQELSKEKKGYAILLGNEPLDLTRKEETVGARLSYLEESLTDVGVIEVMTPFMTQGGSSDTRTAGFTKDQFQRVLLMHFDADMLRNLSRYSCYCAIYSGRGSQEGILTKSNQVVPFVEIISSICHHSSGHGKPTIFIFDCLFETTPPPNIAVVMDTLMEKLHPLPNDVLICLTGQTARPDEVPGVFTLEFAQIYEEFSHCLTLPALLVMAGLKVCLTSSHIVQRPVIWTTLTDELAIGANDPSIPTVNDVQAWSTYCCNVIKKHSSAPLPKPDATPGCGRRVFIIYASDSCGRGLESSPIWPLGAWLTSLGFDVFLDAPEPQENSSWYNWYSTHVLSCRNIVLVCSPLMCSAFNDTPAASLPERYVIAAQLMCSIVRGLQGSEAKRSLRFFPVLFSSVPNVESVPKFFSDGSIYDLTRDPGPPVGTFDSQRVRSAYDTLVFHISRLPVPVTPTSVKETVTDEMIDELLTLKEGYIAVSLTLPATTVPPTSVPVPPPSVPILPIPTQPPANRVTILSSLTASQEVDQSTFLWLAQRVAEWKFMGRHLGVPEYQLTHIERENPHSISEQVIQMLYEWRKATLDEAATNQKLLDSLKFSESSRMCDEFINYLEKKQF